MVTHLWPWICKINWQIKVTYFTVSDILQNLFSSFILGSYDSLQDFYSHFFFGFSLTWWREGWIYNNNFSLFDSIFVESLFLWVKWKLIFGDYKKGEIPFIFYLLYNIKLSWLDWFWCLIFVEFDRNECFQIWHKVLLIDFTMSLFMDSTEFWNSDFNF